MITLQLFARYRELLDVDHEMIEYDAQLLTVGDLRNRLLDRGRNWGVLAEPHLMCARNQEMCGLTEPIADGDEIAFFQERSQFFAFGEILHVALERPERQSMRSDQRFKV